MLQNKSLYRINFTWCLKFDLCNQMHFAANLKIKVDHKIILLVIPALAMTILASRRACWKFAAPFRR